jgi:hypothetical protein
MIEGVFWSTLKSGYAEEVILGEYLKHPLHSEVTLKGLRELKSRIRVNAMKSRFAAVDIIVTDSKNDVKHSNDLPRQHQKIVVAQVNGRR